MIPGIFNSNSGINGEQVDSFSSRIYKTALVHTAPLLALSSGMQRSGLSSKIVHWFEDEDAVARVECVNNAATGTTVTIKNGQTVLPKTVLMNESTGEQMYVTAVNGQSLTVIRGFGDTQIQAMDGSSTAVGLFVLGNAFEEGSLAPQPTFKVGFARYNNAQIFRHSWAHTASAEMIKWHTGNKLDKNRQDCIAQHAKEIENALLFGRKSALAINNQPMYTMDGLTSFIKTNVEACDGDGLTYAALVDFIGELYAHNVEGMPNERMALTSNHVIGIVNQIAMKNGHMQIQVGQNDFGLKVNKVITPFGDLTLLTHPLFNASPVYQNNILAFHPGAIELNYGRDAEVVDSTVPGFDGKQNTVTSELTMQYHCEKTAGLLTNITKANLTK